ncbi:hypothetical protein C3L33_22847, partial [Rhododendron williamsianum]
MNCQKLLVHFSPSRVPNESEFDGMYMLAKVYILMSSTVVFWNGCIILVVHLGMDPAEGDSNDVVPVLRPLNLDDFIQSKAKVGASVAYDATSQNELRKWNEQYGEGGSRRKSPFGF